MLRIAAVTRHFPSSIAPTDGRSTVEVIRLLSRMCNLRVFSAFPARLAFKRFRPSLTRIDRSFIVPGVDVGYYEYPAIQLLSRPLNGWMAARALLDDVRAFQPDLIYSVFLYPAGYSALQICRTLKLPVVVEAVGSDVHSIGDPLSAFFTRKVLRESDFLFTVSESLRKLAVPLGARDDQSRSILNGCDLSVFRPQDPQETRRELGINTTAEVVVYVGRMDIKKGLRELVEAAALVYPQRTNLQVYMVGDGPDRPIIQTMVDRLCAGNFIHLMSGCSFDEVAGWMAAANVVTLPSYAEGCPNTVVEALACGRPVVATDVGGIPEILGPDCGCLVPARDVNALARGLASSLDRKWDPVEISAKNSRSWEIGAAERLRVFESLVSGGAAAAKARCDR